MFLRSWALLLSEALSGPERHKMSKRKIIRINEKKCNGCGLCIPNCKEGALQIIDGKARLVSESFCDGLGACLGHCPQGAITIEERQAEEYDEAKVLKNAAKAAGCPGSRMMDFKGKGESRLSQWPVQIHLVPVNAPYFDGADLLVAADCVPFAYAGFHEDLLKGKVLLIGCPKLDDAKSYQEKITQILKDNKIKSVTCAHMEVPCCFGLVHLVKSAIEASGRKIAYKDVTIGIKGDKLS